MYNSLLRDFEEDPFFSSTRDPFQAHNERVHQMMRSFSDPFGGQLMPSLMDRRDRGHGAPRQRGTSLALRDERRERDTRDPFSMFDSMMMNVRGRMEDMNRNFVGNLSDPNSHSFSSSSIMTYSKVGNEPPKVFQASSETRRVPGGIKETRRALKDSESGLEKMAIGHHIQDRGHVVEKKHNKKTGQNELHQDFQNLDESEAQSFDEEWQREVSKFHPSVPMSRLQAPKPRAVHRAALTGPEQAHREKTRAKAEGKKQTHFNNINVKGSEIKKQY